jgi:hypothetical protein
MDHERQENSPRRTFAPRDVKSFLQCERRFWLERSLAAKALGAEIAPANPKREADASQARERFQSRALAMHGAKIGRPKEHGVEGEGPGLAHKRLAIHPAALALEGGSWRLLGVKASSSTSADALKKAQKEDLFDLALQAWVFERANATALGGATLSFLNKDFTPGPGSAPEDLFVDVDALALLQEHFGRFDAGVDGWLARMEQLEALGAEPEAALGPWCKENGECPFMQRCARGQEGGQEGAQPHPIELLPDSAGKALAKKLKAGHGVSSLALATDAQLASSNPDAQALYRRMRDAHASMGAILEDGAKAFLDALPYPRYYFDFEGIDFAVPRWEGLSPYTQAPFQWSCHVERSPGVFEHAQFLDVSGEDPSERCVEAMISCMPPQEEGPVFVYHATYEAGRIKELALRHPRHAGALGRYLERLVDLLPLTKSNYYHPDMRGSFSIKAVLPCVAPSLSYQALEGVQDGSQAQSAYLGAIDPSSSVKERELLVGQLLAYCRQDTWAMVVLALFLARRPVPDDEAPTVSSAVSGPPEA